MREASNYTIDMAQAKKIKHKKEREISRKQGTSEVPLFSNFSLEQREFIQEMMFELEQEEFFVLYLRYWKDLGTEDIAKLLNLDESQIKKHLEDGMTNLQEMYLTRFSRWKKNLKARMLQL